MKYLQTTDTGQGEVRSGKAITLELSYSALFWCVVSSYMQRSIQSLLQSHNLHSPEISFLSKDINEKIRSRLKLYCSEELRVSIKDNQQKIAPYSHKGGPQLMVLKTRDMSMSPADISNKLPANF